LPDGKEYQKLFQKVYDQLTTTDMMKKYHDLGTPINVAVLNKLNALKSTYAEKIVRIGNASNR